MSVHIVYITMCITKYINVVVSEMPTYIIGSIELFIIYNDWFATKL